jgi:hypothetical protein
MPNREPMEAKESPFCTTNWDSLPLNARAGTISVALTGLAQRNASNKTKGIFRVSSVTAFHSLIILGCCTSLATWASQQDAAKSAHRVVHRLEFSSLEKLPSS